MKKKTQLRVFMIKNTSLFFKISYKTDICTIFSPKSYSIISFLLLQKMDPHLPCQAHGIRRKVFGNKKAQLIVKFCCKKIYNKKYISIEKF